MKLDAKSYLQSGSNELRVLEYRLGGMSFGINILKVSKIISEIKDFINIPEAHPSVKGVFRDMNRLVPIIDLVGFLGLKHKESKYQKMLVTEFFGLLTGFRVDRIDWIHHFNWKDVIDAGEVFSDKQNKYVIGIVKPEEDHIVQLLDYESILLELHPGLTAQGTVELHNSVNLSEKRILIAEDSPAVRSMLVNRLSALGCTVDATCDGAQAWEKFQDNHYDMVVSDVEMPQMDGLALTFRIRQSERSNTPVIVYSSIGDIGMKARAAHLKADAHITKLDLNKLLQAAEKLIKGEKLTPEEAGFGSVSSAT